MDDVINLDVLVVYSSSLATSASVTDSYSKHPFLLDSEQANYNLSYAYFLEYCKENKLTAGLTTSADVIGPGSCDNFWQFQFGQWSKVEKKAQSHQIFDKFFPNSPARVIKRKLLLSGKLIEPFNDKQLFATFFDKLLTYQQLPSYTIPTVGIVSSKISDIKKSLSKLRSLIRLHSNCQDFQKDIVLKDRFGAGGNYVYEINKDFSHEIQTIMKANPEVQFVVQPFLSFDTGFAYQKNQTATDIRLIFQHNKLIQCYFRMAKLGDFRCNLHQGGQLIYVTPDDIPKIIQTIAKEIVQKIDKPESLYALDFVISNSGHVYLIEGNIGPGIDWDSSQISDEQMSKKLIHRIIKEFASRIKRSRVKSS
ncbi:MAG: YheC/YheD family protein [Patescibacteria group bacterium]